MQKLLFTLLLIVTAIENEARESIRPPPEVGQIIKDLEEVHIDDSIERGAPCMLDIQKDLPSGKRAQPLYLHPDTDSYWLPNGDGQLVVPRGASIELYCDSSFANMDSQEESVSIHARCLHDTTFEWTGGKQELQDFYCTQQLKYAVERLEQQPCGDGNMTSAARIYRVGYNVSGGRFVRTLELCHDAEQLRTEYVYYQMLPASVHFQRHVKRPQFSSAGHFCGYDMQRLYSQAHQQKRAKQLLQQAAPSDGVDVGVGVGLGEDMKSTLFDTKDLFLARGHLAAKADLIYATQQRSTFNYLNVAPQWQTLNAGHWAVVEEATRRFAAREKLSLSIYTGTYGVMPLPNATQTSFYLANDANNNHVLPVPLLFYRLVIDNDRPWSGIAIVGVNNPHATWPEIWKSYMICETRIPPRYVPWLRSLQQKNLKKGYLYACTVADVARAVGHLPPHLLEVHEPLIGEDLKDHELSEDDIIDSDSL
ncbi:uncharacterized protein LOC133843681 [Drosophila sulfurigaster albostrigata]|uniref:uncharacterized protein LOC133843681 n=1 Tax=Drosophila sulfurigaster albostrigata TaxID=89887 RepID=UPI002D21879B|nr:uncharacterized protein LOC133843681 [Drosophila sulfurigaster albostrigata]